MTQAVTYSGETLCPTYLASVLQPTLNPEFSCFHHVQDGGVTEGVDASSAIVAPLVCGINDFVASSEEPLLLNQHQLSASHHTDLIPPSAVLRSWAICSVNHFLI